MIFFLAGFSLRKMIEDKKRADAMIVRPEFNVSPKLSFSIK
jgi:hypothetical protein